LPGRTCNNQLSRKNKKPSNKLVRKNKSTQTCWEEQWPTTQTCLEGHAISYYPGRIKANTNYNQQHKLARKNKPERSIANTNLPGRTNQKD
jgi:hypothetical protein